MNRNHTESTAIAKLAAAGVSYDPKLHGMVTSPHWFIFRAVEFLRSRGLGHEIAEAWNGRGYAVNVVARETNPNRVVRYALVLEGNGWRVTKAA